MKVLEGNKTIVILSKPAGLATSLLTRLKVLHSITLIYIDPKVKV